MAVQVTTKLNMAKANESILGDKFSYGFIPEGNALPETRLAACGEEASTSVFILGHMSNGT